MQDQIIATQHFQPKNNILRFARAQSAASAAAYNDPMRVCAGAMSSSMSGWGAAA